MAESRMGEEEAYCNLELEMIKEVRESEDVTLANEDGIKTNHSVLDLRRPDLGRMDLRRMDRRRQDLRRLDLRRLDLRRLDQRRRNLRRLDLRRRDLRRLDQRRLDLRRLDLGKLDLRRLDLHCTLHTAPHCLLQESLGPS